MGPKLQKTSVQLTPDMLRDVSWPGLTKSEAIRLSIDRINYLSSLNAEEISSLAFQYAQILDLALDDFGYADFRAAARALPAIVAGFLRENSNRSWREDPFPELDPNQLMEALEKLDASGRIGILDCVVARRNEKSDCASEPEKDAQPTG